jgi:hypothetical protein
MSCNEHNMCALFACRAFAAHTHKMKDKAYPLSHEFKYAVRASKNKFQHCAFNIFSAVFNFHFQMIVCSIFIFVAVHTTTIWFQVRWFLCCTQLDVSYAEDKLGIPRGTCAVHHFTNFGCISLHSI